MWKLTVKAIRQITDPGRYSDITAHGFRPTFRDWCKEYAKADWAGAELSLAHLVGDETERTYARSDLLEQRRVFDGDVGRVRIIGCITPTA